MKQRSATGTAAMVGLHLESRERGKQRTKREKKIKQNERKGKKKKNLK